MRCVWSNQINLNNWFSIKEFKPNKKKKQSQRTNHTQCNVDNDVCLKQLLLGEWRIFFHSGAEIKSIFQIAGDLPHTQHDQYSLQIFFLTDHHHHHNDVQCIFLFFYFFWVKSQEKNDNFLQRFYWMIIFFTAAALLYRYNSVGRSVGLSFWSW